MEKEAAVNRASFSVGEKGVPMQLQKLLSLIRQAVDRYNMIAEGDKIAVGVSGGKDSLTLLYALKKLSQFYPKHFTVCAICVDLGYDNTDFTGIDEFCRNLDVPLTLIFTQIGKIVMEERKESNPCSLCAKLRKGALVDEAVRLGCTRIAYAHHKDDFVETMLMSMIFQGKFYAFPPVTLFEDKNLRVIRPLMLVEESQVKGFVKRQEFPVLKSPCPIDGTTKRAYAKDLVAQLQKDHPGTKERLFHAITEGKIEDWDLPGV